MNIPAIWEAFFSLGWIDFVVPTDITIVMLLASMVKKHWHILIYIISYYAAYVSVAVAVYFGVDKYLVGFYRDICAKYPTAIGIGKIVIGVGALIGAIFVARYLIRKLKAHQTLNMTTMVHIQSAAPWFLVVFAFGYVWSGIYACYPLLCFIGILAGQEIPFAAGTFWLALFCLFATLPQLIIYILLRFAKGSKVQKILDILTKVMTYICFYAIPFLLLYVAWWGVSGGIAAL